LAQGADGDDFSSEVSPLLSLLTKGQLRLVYDLRDTVTINRIFAREDIKSVMPRDIRFLWSVKPQKTDGQELLELHAIKAPRGTDHGSFGR
jgi:SecD/SecF fusion protein